MQIFFSVYLQRLYLSVSGHFPLPLYPLFKFFMQAYHLSLSAFTIPFTQKMFILLVDNIFRSASKLAIQVQIHFPMRWKRQCTSQSQERNVQNLKNLVTVKIVLFIYNKGFEPVRPPPTLTYVPSSLYLCMGTYATPYLPRKNCLFCQSILFLGQHQSLQFMFRYLSLCNGKGNAIAKVRKVMYKNYHSQNSNQESHVKIYHQY